jgi:hypothetical protein
MVDRRTFSKALTAGAASVSIGAGLSAASAPVTAGDPKPAPAAPTGPSTALGPVRQVRTDLLDLAYHEAGPAGGHPVM